MGYAMAVACSALAVLGTVHLGWFMERNIFLLFLTAVTVSSLYGGLGPGIVTTALCTAGAAAVVFDPSPSLAVAAPADRLRLLLYFLAGLLISGLAEALRRNRERAEARGRALEEANAVLGALIHAAPPAIVALGPGGAVEEWNPAAERLFGWSRDEVIGRPPPPIALAPADGEADADRDSDSDRDSTDGAGGGEGDLWALVRGAASLRDREARCRRRDGTWVDSSLSVAPLSDGSGQARGAVAVVADITERRLAERSARRLIQERAARQQAEQARVHAAFLAEAGSVLASSLDYDATLASVARVAVPLLADGCVVYAAGEDGRVRRVARVPSPDSTSGSRSGAGSTSGLESRFEPESRSGSESRSEVGSRLDAESRSGLESRSESESRSEAESRSGLGSRSDSEPRSGSGSGSDRSASSADDLPLPDSFLRALEDGEPLLMEGVPATEVPAGSGAASMLFTPLRARGRTIGALGFFRERAGAYGEGDLALARELARRAAFAIDNARLYRQAQDATLARDRVMEIVSHDLRNPLGAVMALTDVLLDAPTQDAASLRDSLQTVRGAAGEMERLIRDLLDAAQIEAGHLTVVRQPADAGALLAETRRRFHEPAAARGIRIEARAEPGLPPVLADRGRVLQVMANLVGNALKFTPAGGTVTLYAARQDGAVRLSVRDTGRGIRPEHLPHLFDRFWQAPGSPRRGGVGLGLSIARGIVEVHGGRIWVESAEGQGSTFSFTLPLAPDPAEAPASIKSAASSDG
jgi:signal transduction histidine kinase/PAS domain-containing protein